MAYRGVKFKSAELKLYRDFIRRVYATLFFILITFCVPAPLSLRDHIRKA